MTGAANQQTTFSAYQDSAWCYLVAWDEKLQRQLLSEDENDTGSLILEWVLL
jgi:hypothetical protein